jgi:hypothetical protein
MTLSGSIRLGLGFSACVAVLVLAILLGDVPVRYGPCPEDPANPYMIAHCTLGPPLFVVVLKLVISLLAITAAAALAARSEFKSKVLLGGAAASLCSLFGILAQHAVIAQTFDVGIVPSLDVVGIVLCLFFLFGALIAWATARWWPNTSWARTRE